MPIYKYIAKDENGKTVSGVYEAGDNAELINALRSKGLFIVSVNEVKKRPALFTSPFKIKKITADDLVIFSRQLATMVSAGIPLVTALDVLGEQTEKRRFREVILDLRSEIEAGKSFSEALFKHEEIFSSLLINMSKAGESSGTLDEILDRVATYLEKMNNLRRKIRAALIYPAIVTLMALTITTLLLVKVIPVFKEIYAGFGAELPKPTTILIMVSDLASKYIWAGALALFFLSFTASRFARTDKGRMVIDKWLLGLPVFGVIIRKIAIGKFTRTLSTLVRSGVPILTCLEIVGKTSGNKVIEKAVDEVRASIREGETIAAPLEKSKVFPPMVVRMVSIGEKSGQLDKMLTKISDFYDEQVEAAVSGLTSMIEPLIIAFLGVVIGSIVICMFLPIFKITTIIGA